MAEVLDKSKNIAGTVMGYKVVLPNHHDPARDDGSIHPRTEPESPARYFAGGVARLFDQFEEARQGCAK